MPDPDEMPVVDVNLNGNGSSSNDGTTGQTRTRDQQQSEEKPKDPFNESVQELQAQEKDMQEKIKHIEKRIEEGKVGDTGTAKELLSGHKAKLDELEKKITDAKLEDLGNELEELGKSVDSPERLDVDPEAGGAAENNDEADSANDDDVNPDDDSNGNDNGDDSDDDKKDDDKKGKGTGGGGSKASGSGMIRVGLPTKFSNTRHEVTNIDKEFIVARDLNTVWVWNRGGLFWDAKLETQDDIVALEKVDGTIAVRTDKKLWLFNPLTFGWIGELEAKVEEITSFNIKVPTIKKKEE